MTSVAIRLLRTHQEFRECARIQRAVWGTMGAIHESPRRGCYCARCQSLIVWSRLPEASVRPSGLKATESTALLCPLKVCLSMNNFHGASANQMTAATRTTATGTTAQSQALPSSWASPVFGAGAFVEGPVWTAVGSTTFGGSGSEGADAGSSA